jgi:hypothetical protein
MVEPLLEPARSSIHMSRCPTILRSCSPTHRSHFRPRGSKQPPTIPAATPAALPSPLSPRGEAHTTPPTDHAIASPALPGRLVDVRRGSPKYVCAGRTTVRSSMDPRERPGTPRLGHHRGTTHRPPDRRADPRRRATTAVLVAGKNGRQLSTELHCGTGREGGGRRRDLLAPRRRHRVHGCSSWTVRAGERRYGTSGGHSEPRRIRRNGGQDGGQTISPARAEISARWGGGS